MTDNGNGAMAGPRSHIAIARFRKQDEHRVGIETRMRMRVNKSSFQRILRRSSALACAVGLSTFAAQAQGPAARAKPTPPGSGHQQFPPDHPAFRFDLPANWTVDRGNEDRSMLICSVTGHGDIGLLCMGIPNVFSQEDFAHILPGLAQEHLEQQGISEFQIASQGNAQAGGLSYYFVITKGKLKNKTMSITLIGLVSPQGRGYLMEYALPSSDGPAHVKEFQTIMDSLAAIQ